MPDALDIKVAIIDYHMGNLFSVAQACRQVGLNPTLASQKEDILKADGIILPGVGAFGDAMAALKELDFISPLKDFIQSGRPFFGICLGMQLLMSESEEFGLHKGLDIIKGSVKRLTPAHAVNQIAKVPEVGWNQIRVPSGQRKEFWNNTPLQGLADGEYMYFVHSYIVRPQEKGVTLSTSCYEGAEFCSSLLHNNVFAVQYHPEKSAQRGLQIYKNWFSMICDSWKPALPAGREKAC